MGLSELSFSNSKIVTAGGVRDLIGLGISDGMVSEIRADGDAGQDGYGSVTVLPGFVDVHNHGAYSVDVNSASSEQLFELAGRLATEGVAAWLPTLVPDSDEQYQEAIAAIDALMERQAGEPVAQAVGVHYEGVFAAEKMCGALRPEYFKPYRPGVVESLPRLRNGVHMTTLAPEIEGGIELIREFVSAGWIVSIGHTRADRATLDAAFEAGARHATHFFNAMTGIHHRDLGVAGWCLTKDGMTFDIIADSIHVESRMLDLAVRAKGVDSVSLISDSIAPTGLGDGEYELWGQTITVKNCRTRNAKGGIAGSVITMHDAVKTMLGLGYSFEEFAGMSSGTPARLLGLGGRYGSLGVGRPADLVGLDARGNLVFSMVNGQMVQK